MRKEVRGVPGPTPHYPPEFKREAVQLYRSSERSIPKVAKELRWLRRENRVLKQEKGILRKAGQSPWLVFFAREDGIR